MILFSRESIRNFPVALRLTLSFISTIVAIGLGFFLPRHWMSPVFHYSGYYFMFFAFVLWVALAIDALKKDFLNQIKTHAPAFLLAVVLISVIFHISPPEFKILADETNLISNSMAMHQNKTASMPIEGMAVEYYPFDYRQNINPRPLLYPFVVSVFHAVIGYSPYNGMAVNFVFGAGILFLIYILISLVFSRFFGIAAMIITASFPIFTFWVTSSGFETINLFFIIVVMLALLLFLKSREIKYAEFVMISLVLLANCRYESALFIFPLIFLLPYFLNRHTITAYRLHVLCLPMFFLPIAWQRQIAFLAQFVRDDMGVAAADQVFGITNFINNFSQNIFVLTGMNSDFGFLPLIFVAAVAGIYLSIKKSLFDPNSISQPNRAWGLYVGISGLLLFILYTSFFWGQFSTDINNRLAMAMLPFIIFPAVYCIYRFFHQRIRTAGFLLILLLSAQMVYYWPVAAEQRLLKQNALHYVNKRVTHYLYQHYDVKKEKLLLISDRPNLYVICGIGSIGFQNAVANKKKLHYLDNVYYDQILVLQKCNPITNEVHPDNRLNDGFLLREIDRINVSPDYYLRISRVTCLQPSRQ